MHFPSSMADPDLLKSLADMMIQILKLRNRNILIIFKTLYIGWDGGLSRCTLDAWSNENCLFVFRPEVLMVVLLSQITYSSDYFQELYDLAVELIKRGRAYVDHQVSTINKAEILPLLKQQNNHCIFVVKCIEILTNHKGLCIIEILLTDT